MNPGDCSCGFGLVWTISFSSFYTENPPSANGEFAPLPQPAAYSHWSWLVLVAWMMQRGMSLTDAAQEAGFSDAAHFNHVFREMVGLKPSFIQRAMAYTRIYLAGMLAVDGAAVNEAGRRLP